MFDCNNLLHPFQNDPGISQHQRIMDDLLNGDAKIDGRTLADLLDYFTQLSLHIQFYDSDLSVSNWQPFFQKSLPFVLAGAIKFDRTNVSDKVERYAASFETHPSGAGLQLLLHFLFFELIDRINSWHAQLQDSGLPTELVLLKLIKDKLRAPMQQFICLHNVAVTYYCIRPLTFEKIAQNEAWGLGAVQLSTSDCRPKEKTSRNRLIAMYKKVQLLIPVFLDATRIISDTSALCIEQSILPLKEELKEKHPPHLALLFSFLKLFQHLQGDLNSFTKKHLDFFYKEVLKLKATQAVPDKVHLVFEIQKQLDNYLLRKGLLAKDGKDNNKAEVLFSLDEEIVVNKAQVADKRTLFLNNQNILEKTILEGVYMAPDAGKADGITNPFKEGDAQSFPTPGAKLSKYVNPETGLPQPYPNARIGFALASPVLLLNEGERKIDITLACELKTNYCAEMHITAPRSSNDCCEERNPNEPEPPTPVENEFESLIASELFFEKVRRALNDTYYYLDESTITAAVKKGIGKTLQGKLRKLLSETTRICYCESDTSVYDLILTEEDWRNQVLNAAVEAELPIINELVKPRKAFKLSFSGAKEWLEPGLVPEIEMVTSPLPPNKEFLIAFRATLNPDQPGVTFFDKEKLKEDFDTTLPLVKIELDDKIKLSFTRDELEALIDSNRTDHCCLLKDSTADEYQISLYHFFRNVVILDVAEGKKTNIEVSVCGVKNFVVKNEESVQNVNAPIYPFGTRPEVPDFKLVNPPDEPLPHPNLVGPDFYIGSKEVMGKKWKNIFININWKNKPSSFEEYYKGYWVDPTDSTNFGLHEKDFLINIAVLDDGFWRKEKIHPLENPPPAATIHNSITGDENRPLFKDDGRCPFCLSDPTTTNPVEQTILVSNEYFESYANAQEFTLDAIPLTRYDVGTRNGFLKINLQNQDFLHKDYSFALARQMMAFGRYPTLIDGAIYIEGGTPAVFDISVFFGNIGPKVIELANNVVNSAISGILDDLVNVITTEIENTVPTNFINGLIAQCKNLLNQVKTIASLADIHDLFDNIFDVTTLANSAINDINNEVKSFVENLFDLIKNDLDDVEGTLKDKIKEKFDDILDAIDTGDWFGELYGGKEVPIPNEPWTPIIKNISLDYNAVADISDIDLIHLYPYENTHKREEITLLPTLLPCYCDEGNLFVGLKDLVPGSNLNILFQLAEATADSESDREEVDWYCLVNNQWKLLRPGFEILDDATNGLTGTGIISFSLPASMTSENTILPKGLYWIRASIPNNSRSVCETIGIHTQAIRTTFTNDVKNDQLRLATPLPAGSIARLNEADTHVKKVTQPYDSFDGRLPEDEGHFYVRVSEQLRHKGRAVQKFDYERLALEAFPQLFKVKCINHSFALNAHQYRNDFPVAPGYVILAVIPDLNQLKAARSFEPRAPVSMLEDIAEYMKQHTSPFVRFRAMNPRYEKIHFCLKVKLFPGKDETYYKEKLKQDIRELLAPWAVGKYDKLSFGQCVNRSSIIRLVESGGYVDYILEIRMEHEEDTLDAGPSEESRDTISVCPKTPRSILIAGNIDVCIPGSECEEWNRDDRCENQAKPGADYCPEIIIG